MKTAYFSLVIAIAVAFLSVFQFVKYQNLAIESRQNLKKLDDSVNERFATLKKEVEWLASQEQSLMQQTAHLAEFHNVIAQLPAKSGQLPSQAGQLPSQAGQLPNQSGQLPSQSGQLPNPRQLPGQGGQLPGPGGVPGPGGQLPDQAGQLPDQGGQSGQSMSGQTHDQMSGQMQMQLQSQMQAQMHTQMQALLKNELQSEMRNQLKTEIRNQNTTLALAEAQFLVQNADLRLKTLRDVKAAILLLNSATDKLKTLKEPKYAALQTALHTDIMNLQTYANQNAVSPSDLWLQISAVIEKANGLPLRENLAQPNLTNTGDTTTGSTTAGNTTTSNSTTNTNKDTNTASTATANPSAAESNTHTWKEAIHNGWQEIKDLVKIRHHNRPVEPLLSLNEQNLVKENLRLLLEQLRFATLNNDTAVYRKAIQEIQLWLSTYFDESNDTVKAIQNDLTKLAGVDLQPKLPAMQSLAAFNALMNSASINSSTNTSMNTSTNTTSD